MVLLGSIVNGICIVVGTIIGRFFRNIPEKMKQTVMFAIGLSVVLIGLQMGFQSEQILIVILSLVIGAVLGEWMRIDDRLNTLGLWLEKKFNFGKGNYIAQGFVTGTLIFVVGAMAILGALDSGIRGDHSILYTKSLMDGFTSIILASTLGLGVIFSAIPVVLYQGVIALFATQIDKFVPTELLNFFITEMTAVGGLMIVAIGLNIMDLTKIRVANLLPAIIIVGVFVSIFYYGNIQL